MKMRLPLWDSGRASLHRLVEVTSFVGAQRVEGGHHKLPVKGPARQQALSLFGVAGVGVLHKHLKVTESEGQVLMVGISHVSTERWGGL